MSWRKLRVLVTHLPAESATHTAMRVAAGPEAVEAGGDPAEGSWSHTDMLLAAVVDALHALQWTYVAAHSKHAPPRPQPVRRPGIDTGAGAKHTLTVAGYRALMGADPPAELVLEGS